MAAPWPVQRGRIYAARLAHIDGDKYFVVVSNNLRNRRFPQVLGVRLTTTPKPLSPSNVPLSADDPVVGTAVCDDIVELYGDEIRRDLGAVSRRTMARIESGLSFALGFER